MGEVFKVIVKVALESEDSIKTVLYCWLSQKYEHQYCHVSITLIVYFLLKFTEKCSSYPSPRKLLFAVDGNQYRDS